MTRKLGHTLCARIFLHLRYIPFIDNSHYITLVVNRYAVPFIGCVLQSRAEDNSKKHQRTNPQRNTYVNQMKDMSLVTELVYAILSVCCVIYNSLLAVVLVPQKACTVRSSSALQAGTPHNSLSFTSPPCHLRRT